jgi:hypothetical protein
MMPSTGTCGKLTRTKPDEVIILIGPTDDSEDSPHCSCLVVNSSCMCKSDLLTNGIIADASLKPMGDSEMEWSMHNSSNI